MQLFLLGLNHKTAPVEVRERLALAPSRLPEALQGLREHGGAREAVILSTCNRAEIYILAERDAGPQLERFVKEFHHIPPHLLDGCLYRRQDVDAARHLFRVACGIDSLVLGESQILGQVKAAFDAARGQGAVSHVLDELFRRAIGCGKRARAETEIGRGALSVGSAAVELARQIFGPLRGHTILILGAGKISSLTARHLVASGAHRVLVANRTFDRARELAAVFAAEQAQAEAVPWEEFPRRLAEADIVIASTGAPGFVLTAAQTAGAMKARRHRPLFLVDIAVPRDIEPAAHQIDNVYVYDIDDLQGVVNTNLVQRSQELSAVADIVEEEVEAWSSWYRSLTAHPVMAALAQRTKQVRELEVEAALAQLPNLTPREQEVVRALGKSIANKLVHPPLRHLRQAGAAGDVDDIEAVRRAFAIDEAAIAACRAGRNKADYAGGNSAWPDFLASDEKTIAQDVAGQDDRDDEAGGEAA